MSPEGKARSALNATPHGLLARHAVLPEESSQDFDALVKAYLIRLAAAGTYGSCLVEKMAASSGQKISYSWKYKLLSGDGVEFYDMPKELQQKGGGVFGKGESSKVKVTIDGDNMTVTGSDGTGKLTRVK